MPNPDVPNDSSPSENLDAASVDTTLWPNLDEQNGDGPEWASKIGRKSADEYVAALQGLESASLNADGTLAAGDRTFRLSIHKPAGRTRLDWKSADGEAYAFAFETTLEPQFCELAQADPINAARELSRRFALAVTANAKTPTLLARQIHALAIRHLFINEGRNHVGDNPCAYPDEDTGKVTISIAGLDDVASDYDAALCHGLYVTSLDGGPADRGLKMFPSVVEGSLWPDPLISCSQDVVLRLGNEANAILSASGLPTIPDDLVASIASSAEHVGSFQLLQQFEKSPTQSVHDQFEVGIDPADMKPQREHPLIRDLETTQKVENGLVRTATRTYRLIKNVGRTRYHILCNKSDEDGSKPLLTFGRGSQFDTDASSLAFLRSLRSRFLRNVPRPEVKAHDNLLRIIGNAVVERQLASEEATSAGELAHYSVQIECLCDGTIEMAGSGGRFSLHREPILIIEDDHVSGLTASNEDSLPACSRLAAHEMLRSSAATFERLGIQAKPRPTK